MRLSIPALLAVAALAAPATASADFHHVVARGESLSSVAATDGLSVSELAAANGISPTAELTAGTELAIPPRGAAATAASEAGAPATATDAAPATTASAAAGDYRVRPGDTLSAIAARYGVSVASLAAANGLSVSGVLLSGATLTIGGAPVSATPPVAAPATHASSLAPSPESVSAADVGAAADRAGVSASLAEAIGYQESGYDNALVSRTGAIGVMQIEPSTWSYLHDVLGVPDAGTGAAANVAGGVAYLHSLLGETGGDETEAIAAYYQGLHSVRQHGILPGTERYVRNVEALQGRFGG